MIQITSFMLFIKHALLYSKFCFIFNKPKYIQKVARVIFFRIKLFINRNLSREYESYSNFFLVDNYEIFYLKFYDISILLNKKKLKIDRYIISFNCIAFHYKLYMLVLILHSVIRAVRLLFLFKTVLISLYIETNKCDSYIETFCIITRTALGFY